MATTIQRRLTRNRITVRDNGDGSCTAILRHSRGAHTWSGEIVIEELVSRITAELDAIHEDGGMASRPKAERIYETLKAR